MEAALKQRCVPVLRKQGFEGSFPNFHREKNDFISLINFQFFSSGGSFCVNLGYIDPAGRNAFHRNRMKVDNTRDRKRLGSNSPVSNDRWFSFGKTNYHKYRGTPFAVNDLADECVRLFLTEAEEWWHEKQMG